MTDRSNPHAENAGSEPPARRSNRALIERYDALVQAIQDRIEASASSSKRFILLSLITRLNKRGMRELERRQRASEDELWAQSLMPKKSRPGKWL